MTDKLWQGQSGEVELSRVWTVKLGTVPVILEWVESSSAEDQSYVFATADEAYLITESDCPNSTGDISLLQPRSFIHSFIRLPCDTKHNSKNHRMNSIKPRHLAAVINLIETKICDHFQEAASNLALILLLHKIDYSWVSFLLTSCWETPWCKLEVKGMGSQAERIE